jgi:ribose transport system permease protein
MTVAPTGTTTSEPQAPFLRPGLNPRRVASRHGWTIGVYGLLVVLLVVYALVAPQFTSFDLGSIVIGALPLAFAAMAQSVIVISGGIDLSLGTVMATINVIAASLMKDQSFVVALLIAVGLMAVGTLIGAINGGLIVGTGVPDIVVTLAMSFVWGGVALVIMKTPGGGAPDAFQALGTGTVLSAWIPAGAIVLAVVLLAVWVPFARRRAGFAVYAVGSDRDRAYLAGVDVGRTRILAYALGGFFAGLGGLALMATTGIGSPYAGDFITLNSVAAVVLGGVSLVGGKGGLVGPVAAAFCLNLVPSIMVFEGIDPNYGQVVQGALIVIVVMIGGLLLLRRRT